jgi:hypothetical protein
MPRRLSIEERIKRLEEKKTVAIAQAVRRINAIYSARIDLLREKGLPSKKPEPDSLSLKQRIDLAKDRHVFYKTRYYMYMGLPQEEAQRMAEEEFIRYRTKYLGFFFEDH